MILLHVASADAWAEAQQSGLVLPHIDPAMLGDLRWEASGPGRDAFPHLYGPLPTAAVVQAEPVQP